MQEDANEPLSKTEIISGIAVAMFVIFCLVAFNMDGDEPVDRYIRFSDIQNQIHYESVEPHNQPVVEQAISAFLNHCEAPKRLTKTMHNIEVLLVKESDSFDYRRERYGWDKYIELTFTAQGKEAGRTSGHTLRYYMGGGSNAGAVCQKTECQTYCLDMDSAKAGAEMAAYIPALKTIDAIH